MIVDKGLRPEDAQKVITGAVSGEQRTENSKAGSVAAFDGDEMEKASVLTCLRVWRSAGFSFPASGGLRVYCEILVAVPIQGKLISVINLLN